MTPFDPALATELAAEMAEDDERCTGDRWGNDGIDVYTLTDNGQGFPFDRYPDSVDVIVGKCSHCGERGGVVRADDEAAIVRLRNNARSAAEQLRAAVAEVERLREKVSDMRSERVRDEERLTAKKQRLRALTLNPGVTLHGSTITEIAADRDRLAVRVKELEALAGEACDIADIGLRHEGPATFGAPDTRAARMRDLRRIRSRLGGE